MRTVRLLGHDLKAIIALFKQHFLANDHLWLFGSRLPGGGEQGLWHRNFIILFC